MAGSLTLSQEGTTIGVLTPKGYHRVRQFTRINGLHPGLRAQEPPPGEDFVQVKTFLSRFLDVDGNYPASDFWVPGWVNSIKNRW